MLAVYHKWKFSLCLAIRQCPDKRSLSGSKVVTESNVFASCQSQGRTGMWRECQSAKYLMRKHHGFSRCRPYDEDLSKRDCQPGKCLSGSRNFVITPVAWHRSRTKRLSCRKKRIRLFPQFISFNGVAAQSFPHAWLPVQSQNVFIIAGLVAAKNKDSFSCLTRQGKATNRTQAADICSEMRANIQLLSYWMITLNKSTNATRKTKIGIILCAGSHYRSLFIKEQYTGAIGPKAAHDRRISHTVSQPLRICTTTWLGSCTHNLPDLQTILCKYIQLCAPPKKDWMWYLAKLTQQFQNE